LANGAPFQDVSLFSFPEVHVSAAGIYRITVRRGDQSPRFYIGQSVNLRKRASEHLSRLRVGTAHNRALQNAVDLYGIDAVTIETLLVCAPIGDVLAMYEDLVLRFHIATFGARSMFNARVADVSASIGVRHSDETRARISAALKGRKHRPESIALGVAKRIGRKLSPETIALRTAKQTGIKRSAETRERMSAAARGRKISPEAIAKNVATRAANRAARGGALSERQAAHILELAARNRKAAQDVDHGR
jgi:group I intron endonuclease